ncbi:DUF4136 domain-containing protein [Gilvimarinus agarilyticus]|uniref:DUF4136 domain-containing protein n=1 Tax=Gilvimarinus agarilyticus TaxID=679259 RepID=UPI0005A0FB57|nr:DUF4136 domain-containing protein [Gilvimarinus agarilyticus]
MTLLNPTIVHRIKRRLLTPVALGVTLLATMACTTTTEPVTARYTSSLVSVREPGFEFVSGDSYNWLGEIEVVADTEHGIKESTIAHIRDTLERDLAAGGHPKVSSGADYLLAATIIVGNSVSESELIERYEISPSLTQQSDYEAGTMVLRVINPASLRTEWRAAMELFTDPHETDAERIAKVDKAIDAFIRQLAN